MLEYALRQINEQITHTVKDNKENATIKYWQQQHFPIHEYLNQMNHNKMIDIHLIISNQEIIS